MSKTIIAVKHFGLGGRESLETAVSFKHFMLFIIENLLHFQWFVIQTKILRNSFSQLSCLKPYDFARNFVCLHADIGHRKSSTKDIYFRRIMYVVDKQFTL